MVAWLTTRDANPLRIAKKAAPVARVSKVDERPLETARQVAALADTHAEQELVEEAARLAGQEVDRDFGSGSVCFCGAANPGRSRLCEAARAG
jgi:hypothetical protein